MLWTQEEFSSLLFPWPLINFFPPPMSIQSAFKVGEGRILTKTIQIHKRLFSWSLLKGLLCECCKDHKCSRSLLSKPIVFLRYIFLTQMIFSQVRVIPSMPHPCLSCVECPIAMFILHLIFSFACYYMTLMLIT